MRSVTHAKHAKPAFHPTRSTLSAGLTAVLLPLCLASPALADTASSASPSPAASSGVDPSSSPTATPAAGPTDTPTATTSPSPESARAQTTLRLAGPRGIVERGRHGLAVRLLADDKPVKNGYVRVERLTGSGWEYAGRLLTDANGLGYGTWTFTKTVQLRAVYQGSATRSTGESAELTVRVAKTADFRAQAVRVASQQRGKPYRYGSTGPSSFDCSGLVKYVFSRVGRNLPRTSGEQLRATQRVTKSMMRPGDLVFTNRGGRIGHVGVYAGNGRFWVAPKSGDVVKLQKIYTSDFKVGRVR